MSPETCIPFSLPSAGRARLTVFGVDGRHVVVLADEHRDAGVTSVTWNGRDDEDRDVPSGVYFYRLEAGDQVVTRRLVVAR